MSTCRVTVVEHDRRVVVVHSTPRTTVVHAPKRVIVRDTQPRLTVIQATKRVIVRGTGAQGPQGVPGAGYTFYVHTQVAPASAWVIDHNLGRKVHVTLFDDSEVEVEADVVHNTVNQVVINFPSPVTGSAFIS